MNDSESIQNFLTRITSIVNQIRNYGDTIEDKRIVEKVLRSLPLKFDHVAIAIEESKDLSKLTIPELMGSLEAHEKRLNRHSEQSLEQVFQSKMNLKERSDMEVGGENLRGGLSQNSQYGRGKSSFRGR